MSVNKFKFVSPGVFVSEVDNSQLPALPRGVGPVVIGRSLKGPAMRPVQVDSFSEFVETFGNPIFGGGDSDVWRAGPNVSAPSYATYAAQAYLRNESPLVFVRLAGVQISSATGDGVAGWETNSSEMTGSGEGVYGGGAFGLFIAPNPGTTSAVFATASLTTPLSGTVGIDGTEQFILTSSYTSNIYTFIATGSITADQSTTNPFIYEFDAGEGATLGAGITSTNIAAIINASASADFSAISSSAGVKITSTQVGTLGNDDNLSSSLAGALLVATDFSDGVNQLGPFTGSLAAIFYARTGSVSLCGTYADGATEGSGTCGVFKASTLNTFTACIKGADGEALDKIVFNFDENSKLFIRNVFNTNPTAINDSVNVNKIDNQKTYFLGESFERSISDLSDLDNGSYGVILGLESGSTRQHIQRTELENAQTGWFFAQDLGTAGSYDALNMQKLFRFVGLDGAEWPQNNLKISITSITPSNNEANPFGYFTVQIRDMGDSDNSPRPVETYSDVNLNPDSPSYIVRRIGDSYTEWDETAKRYTVYGDYVNQSRYVRVELDSALKPDGPPKPKMLPFGVYGPTRWKGFGLVSGSSVAVMPYTTGTTNLNTYVIGNDEVPDSVADTNNFIKIGTTATPATQLTGTFLFPSVPTRTSSDDGIITNQTDAYFGATANMKDSNRVEASVKDMLRRKPNNKGVQATNPEAIEYSWLFSLDDVEAGVSGSTATWVSGSRKEGDSYTATGDYKTVLDAGFDSFTTLLSEGFEGVNILEKEPFRNTLLGGVTAGTSYTYASLERAIDTVADADVVECNMMSVPGLTESTLTSRLMDVCEARGDALAVIDLPGGYKPITEDANASDSDRIGSVDDTVNLLNDRNINNSYGCAYYPWVQVTDTVTTGGSLWAPPSVVVLGTLASSQAASELWFAPAGFTRGGLTEGSAGLPVTNVRARLNSKERDSLYNTNINPIAQFPAEGIVIFGQKTLQVSQSALDRINVRRLMIYVKREISRIAATMLFEQNVQATWNRFLGKVNPFLGSIKTRLGLTDYLVILDETTTTPDLVDRNILYAKIFLKPARAIEFIALDFVITRTGAGFED